MNRTLTLALIATAALAGCSKEDHTIVAGTRESRETNTVDPSTIKLPPAIEASKSYRCKDNSVVYVDWLNDKMTADIRDKKIAPATRVTTAEAGKPMTAEGYSLSGTSTASSVTVERPGKGSQSCTA